jgi:peptide/nickel transport system substrate-binding protein
VLQAIYDGPIDLVAYSPQPVILEKLPSVADGDARLEPVPVAEGDQVVNDEDEVVRLAPGVVVRPYGCNNPGCAVAWDGSPLEMAQLSADFTLLEGVKWSDGTPLTSADSRFAFEFLRNCPAGLCNSRYAETVLRTADYVPLDERTLRWTGLPGFIDPDYPFNFIHPLPRHIYEAEHLTYADLFEHPAFRESPLGWGPYILEQWERGEQITLRKNPQYFRSEQDLPRFDRLVFRFIDLQPEVFLDALRSGTCDLIDQETSQVFLSEGMIAQLLAMEANGDLDVHLTGGNAWEHLDFSIGHADYDDGFQIETDRPDFFGDVRTRQGVAACIDRQRIIDQVLFGQSQVPHTYLPASHPLFNAAAVQSPYDPQAGAALLEAVGWMDHDNDPITPRQAQGVRRVPDGTAFSLHLIAPDSPQRRQILPLIQQSLAGCGIELLVSYLPVSEFYDDAPDGALFSRRFDLAEFAWLSSAPASCALYLSENIPGDPLARNPEGSPRFPDGWLGQNDTGFSNPEYDQACRAALTALPGLPDYATNHLLAQQIFAEQLPVLPLFNELELTVSRPDLCGYTLDPSAASDTWQIEEFNVGEECKE